MKKRIDSILEKILVTLLSIMLLSVIWQVISRYILQTPSTATDEISSYALIWLGLLGAAYASGQKLHLAIDLIPETVINKRVILFNVIVYGSIFFFAAVIMIIGGLRLCILSFQFKQTSATLHIPLGIVYSVIPISGLIISFYSVYLCIQNHKDHISNEL